MSLPDLAEDSKKEDEDDAIFSINKIGNIEDTIRSDPYRDTIPGEQNKPKPIWGIIFRWRF
jgi:hypothetical protein